MSNGVMQPERASYLPEVDGLRAIAVLLVLFFHFGVFDMGHAGFIGVDIFFVISGYLITSLILRQLELGTFSLAHFYIGRIRRLAPALLVAIVLTVAYGATRLFAEQFIELARQAILAQFYLVNFHFWKEIGYFGQQAADVPLLHLWSLAVEEHFYIFFPLGLLLLHRHARRYLWWGIAGAGLLSFALNLLLVTSKPEFTFYMLPTRAWELLAGALVAGVATHRPPGRLVREGALVAGLSCIVLALVIHRSTTPFPGTFALLPVAGGALMMLAAGAAPTRLSRLLANGPLVYVGRISYPLYLVHWPVQVFSRQTFGNDYGTPLRWLMLCASIALAAAIYHFVEKPVRRQRILASPRTLLVAYTAGVAGIAATFALVVGTGGLPDRFPAEVQRLADYRNDKSPPLTECEFQGKPLSPITVGCRLGAPGAPLTWLVYGDSHAWAAHGVFDAWLRQAGKAGVIFYRNSCPPNLGLHILGDRGRCLAFNNEMLSLLEREKGLQNVFLVSTWRQAVERRLSPRQGLELDREQSIAAFDHAFGELVRRLSEDHRIVHVWEPVPGARDNVPLALARAKLEGRTADLSTPRATYEREYEFFFATLQRYRQYIHARFSPAAAVCDGVSCTATVGDVPAYIDNSHISRSPAPFWVDAMVREGLVP